jgi:hypothetical protein
VIEHVLDGTPRVKFGSIADVLAADGEARRRASEESARLAALPAARSAGN